MKEKDIRLNVSNADNTIFMKVKTVFDKIKLTISTTGIEEYKKQISRYLNQILEKAQECADYFKIVQQLTSRCQELKNNLETFCYDALTQHSEDSHNPHSVTAEQVNAYTKAQTDSLLATKQAVGNYLTEHQSLSNYYTKSEIDAELDGKSDVNHTHNQYLTEHQSLSNYYTKSEVDAELDGKSDVNHTHNQYLTEHQNLSNYYTKLETDTAMNSKSNISNTVTTDTQQNITGEKTFVGSKRLKFKQSPNSTDSLGFTCYNSTGQETAYFAYNNVTRATVDNVPTCMLGNYATSSNEVTYLGFQNYSNLGGSVGAYNLVAPLISEAKTSFTLSSIYQTFYIPLGFTNGNTTVVTAKSGMVDLSSIIPDTVSSVSSTSTNAEAVGAKLFYDTVGNIEALLQGV